MDCLLSFRFFPVTQPEDWFYNAHADGKYDFVNQHHTWVWDLSIGSTFDAIEELGLENFNCHYSLIGIVVVSIFIKPKWLRKYVENVDLYFFIPVGAITPWTISMHEGLTIGLFTSPQV